MKQAKCAVGMGCLAVMLLGLVRPVRAQDTAAPLASREYVRLNFTVRELDEGGKLINTRSFEAMTFATPDGKYGESGKIRQQATIPFVNRNGDVSSYSSLLSEINFSRVSDPDSNHVALTLTTDVKTLLPGENAVSSVIRDVTLSGSVLVPIGERRVIFSSDDMASKHTFQVDLLVARVR